MNEIVLVGTSDEVEPNTFGLFKLKRINEDKKYTDNDMELVFDGDGSMASLLFGWGIVRWMTQQAKSSAMFLFNPQEECSFPGGDDE